jgi:hypothetical protein
MRSLSHDCASWDVLVSRTVSCWRNILAEELRSKNGKGGQVFTRLESGLIPLARDVVRCHHGSPGRYTPRTGVLAEVSRVRGWER